MYVITSVYYWNVFSAQISMVPCIFLVAVVANSPTASLVVCSVAWPSIASGDGQRELMSVAFAVIPSMSTVVFPSEFSSTIKKQLRCQHF